MTTLTPKDQAKYLGFQSMCWNAGFLPAQGPFVTVSGALHDRTGSWATAWMAIMLAIAGPILVAAIYLGRVLPPGAKAQDAPKGFAEAGRTFGHAFTTFFQKRGIWSMIAFSFFYRFG